jgi:trk system potassium uptake protein TrkA
MALPAATTRWVAAASAGVPEDDHAVYVVIVGAGEVGTYLAGILTRENHDVAIIEQDERVAQRVGKDLDALLVHGNGASTHALNAAGIRNADLFIAVTNLDETNMFSCMAARKLGSQQTIARVRDRRYLGENYSLTSKDLDIDLLIGAEHAVAEQIGHMFAFPGLSSHESLADGKLVLIETSVKSHFSGVGQPLSGLNTPRPGNFIAIQREQEFIIPRGDTTLMEHDQVFTLTVPERVEDFLRFFGFPKLSVHNVLIIGGGVIGFHTSRYLEERGRRPTVIESDPDRARWIAQRLKRAVVLQQDATDIDVIREQVQEGHDAVAVLMKEEEKALLIGMYAKYIGATQVVTRVDDFKFAPIAYQMGLDSLISPQRALAQAILEKIRRGRIARAMMLGDNQIEILEFTIPQEGKQGVCNIPLSKLNLPSGALLGGILREKPTEQVIIPRGSDQILPGDHVIVSVLPEAISDVEKVFA